MMFLSGKTTAPCNGEDFFLKSETPLSPGNAVCALIVMEDGRYLMQLRDQRADIFYPGFWGLFGGAVDEGESPVDALYRELYEELEMKAGGVRLFSNFTYELSLMGNASFYRTCYEVSLLYRDYEKLRLHEGEAMQVFEGRDILTQSRIVPYDSFTLWLHYERSRLQFKP